MSTLFNRRIRHATTWVVLLVWLFALAAGVANACMLETRGTHGHAPPGGGIAGDRPDVAARHDHGHASDGGGADHGGSKPSCLKVCDETPQSPAKRVGGADIDDASPAAMLVATWPSRPLPGTAAQAPVLIAPTPPPGPPARVRFSRLAL